MRHTRIVSLLVALMMSVATIAQATPVSYFFSGQLNAVNAPLAGSTFAVGDAFHGFFTFESTSPDIDASPNSGTYDPGPAFSVTIDGLTWTHAIGGPGASRSRTMWVGLTGSS